MPWGYQKSPRAIHPSCVVVRLSKCASTGRAGALTRVAVQTRNSHAAHASECLPLMCSRIASRREPMLASLAELPRATLTPCIFTPIGRLTRCHTAPLTYEQPGQWSCCARRVLHVSVSVSALTPSTGRRLRGMTSYVQRSTTRRYRGTHTFCGAGVYAVLATRDILVGEGNTTS
uniref:Uncharacterized protein n=1 Tax=Tremblaya princeps TaxID=189385 RepID=Q8KTQ6_TREPR|nr:unknown [Candidatus Tremblaya princeps]